MQLCHTPAALSAVFDEPNLIASAGLVPGVALADRIGLRDLADEWLTVPGSTGCAGAKVMSAGGRDARRCGQHRRHGPAAPRRHGQGVHGCARPVHVGVVPALLHLRPRPPARRGRLQGPDRAGRGRAHAAGRGRRAGHARHRRHRQAGVRGRPSRARNMGTRRSRASTPRSPRSAPIAGRPGDRRRSAAPRCCRLRARGGPPGPRRGHHHPPGGGHRADPGPHRLRVLQPRVRHRGHQDRGVVLGRGPTGQRRASGDRQPSTTGAWVRIEYSQAVLDTDTGELVSAAEVAEVPYLAFTSHRTPVAGTVDRAPGPGTQHHEAGRRRPTGGPVPGLAVSRDLHQQPRLHWSKPSPSTAVTPIVEQVIADLKAWRRWRTCPRSRFQANAAWLVAATIAFNLTRAIGVTAGGKFTKAEGATVRARIINTPARVSRSGRRQRLHLPKRWPWADALADPLDHGHDHLTARPPRPYDPRTQEKPEPDRRHRHARIPNHPTDTLRAAQRARSTTRSVD